jgi:hypothetical protein
VRFALHEESPAAVAAHTGAEGAVDARRQRSDVDRREVEQLRERVDQRGMQLERCRQAAYAQEINAVLRRQLELALEEVEEVSEEREKLQHDVWTYEGTVAPIERGHPERMRHRVVVRGKERDT